MQHPEDTGLPTESEANTAPLVSQESIARIEALDRPGETAVLVEILDLFLDSARDRLPRLVAALECGDLEAALVEAHGLKGSAGTVGAQSLAAACSRLEQEARRGALPDGALRALRQLWRDTELALIRIQARAARGTS
jgi:HPt (histidine-containing phosphotransfer) domain-containing protein